MSLLEFVLMRLVLLVKFEAGHFSELIDTETGQVRTTIVNRF